MIFLGFVKFKESGYNIEAHKNDQDTWPSSPHGHDNTSGNKVDKDGKLYDPKTKKEVCQMPNKIRSRYIKWL